MKFSTPSFFLTILCCFLFSTGAAQSATKNPHSNLQCPTTQAQFSNNNLILNTGAATAPAIFVLHNVSHQTIWINHESDQGMSAGWSSSIKPKHWSAIQLTKTNFALQCADTNFKPLDCTHILQACNLIHPPAISASAGSYWLAENKTLRQVKQVLKKSNQA